MGRLDPRRPEVSVASGRLLGGWEEVEGCMAKEKKEKKGWAVSDRSINIFFLLSYY